MLDWVDDCQRKQTEKPIWPNVFLFQNDSNGTFYSIFVLRFKISFSLWKPSCFWAMSYAQTEKECREFNTYERNVPLIKGLLGNLKRIYEGCHDFNSGRSNSRFYGVTDKKRNGRPIPNNGVCYHSLCLEVQFGPWVLCETEKLPVAHFFNSKRCFVCLKFVYFTGHKTHQENT